MRAELLAAAASLRRRTGGDHSDTTDSIFASHKPRLLVNSSPVPTVIRPTVARRAATATAAASVSSHLEPKPTEFISNVIGSHGRTPDATAWRKLSHSHYYFHCFATTSVERI